MRIRDNISNGDKLKIAAMALPSIVAAVTYYFLKLFELKDVVILTVFCLCFWQHLSFRLSIIIHSVSQLKIYIMIYQRWQLYIACFS